MAFFNEFKEKLNKAAQSVSNKTKDSIKDSVEVTRLSSEARNINSEITAAYQEIGRIYVESKGTDHAALAPLCQKVIELKEKLDEIERQKMQIKNQNRCPACGAVMPKNARFCSSCGRRMPEENAEAEPAPSMEDVEFCPNCGAMLEKGEKYCAVCNHGSDEEEPEPEKPSIIISRPIILENEDSSDEAPSDFEAE